MNISGAANYHDLQGLSALRAEAASAPNQAIEEVAAQFESLFVQMMLKSMRDATIDGGLFQSDQMEVYQDMFDNQLAVGLAGQGGLGLAQILVEELGGSQSAPEASENEQPILSQAYPRPSTSLVSLPVAPATSEMADVELTGISEAAPAATTGAGDWNPDSPEDYIRGVWDYAVDAARQLGLDPLVLVAQSALETGWGKKMVQAIDGSSSFNLFGIKADRSWGGDSAAVKSFEFRDGVARLEKSSFRVYDSLANSFDDYVSFLKSNPRYQQALEKIKDSEEFLNELQSAGYATDPGYADKIMRIVGDISYGALIDELKNF